MIKKLIVLAVSVCSAFVLTGGTSTELVHRWSFNGNLNDSIGGQTAKRVGNVTTDGRQYSLAGGSYGSSYVDFGSGILPANGDGITKTLADYVTDDVNKDGVYKALKHFEIID